MSFSDAMTVKQLILTLQGLPKTARVYFNLPGEETYPVRSVDINDDSEPVMVLLEPPEEDEDA